MAENSPNLKKETDSQVQEEQSVPNKINLYRNTPSHIMIKMAQLRDKEKILKAARNKESVTKERPLGYQLISLQKLCRPARSGIMYSKS